MSEKFMPYNPSNPKKTEPSAVRTERPSERHIVRSVIADIRDSIYDRARAADSDRDVVLPEIPSDILENLGVDEFLAVAENAIILRLFNGHRGQRVRELAKMSVWPEANHVRALLKWSGKTAESADYTLDETYLSKPPGMLLDRSSTPESLAEYFAFTLSRPDRAIDDFDTEILRASSESLGLSGGEPKWSLCAKRLFSSRDIRSELKTLIAQVGSIPLGILTNETFPEIPPERVCDAIDALRSLEEDATIGRQARYERSKLINHLFLSRGTEALKTADKSVTLDANGLFVNLRNFHSHLPYGLIRPETIEAMSKHGWLSKDETLETDLRAAEANREIDRRRDIAERQLRIFAQEFDVNAPDVSSILQELSPKILGQPESFTRKIRQKNLIVPDSLIDALIATEPPKGLSALAAMAESIGQSVSNETLYREPDLFSSHKILQSTRETYEARSKVLNAPEYYNVVKIARSILGKPIQSDPQERFIAFYGRYKKNKGGQQHTFLDIYHRHSGSRILLNEEKHLDAWHRSSLHALPHLERKQYEDFENALKTFDYSCATVDRMKKVIGRKAKNWRKNTETLSETALHFVLSNVTGHYQAALSLRDSFLRDPDDERIASDMISVFESALSNYEEYLYAHVGGTGGPENLSPEIDERKVTFDADYFDEARRRIGAGNFRAEIENRESPFSIRVASIHYKIHDPSQTIPFHIEESCLDAIRLNRGRPLINVIGGCRHLSDSDPLEEFAVAVMRVGHDHKANIGIPGTQSGLGNTFGIQNMHYHNLFGHIPHRDRAHFFAVNPGGSVFFPGNPYTEKSPADETFAAAPVDMIVTPCLAGWELKGKDKLRSPYLDHIAYMESIYRRVAGDQPKIMVVGNGGLYSIVEINESLRQGFDLILLRDSGRFAEAVASILESPNPPDMSRDAESIARDVIDRVRAVLSADIANEFLRKDFGSEPVPENDDYLVYRMYFFEFLKTAAEKRDRIRTTKLRDLEPSLREMLARK